MARENQGLQIALIIFVMLTIVLGVTTFVGFNKYGEALKNAKDNSETATNEMRRANNLNTECGELKKIIGFAPSTSLVDVQNQYKTDMDKYQGALPDEAARFYRPALEQVWATLGRKTDSLHDAEQALAEFTVKYEKREGIKDKQFENYVASMKKAGEEVKILETGFAGERFKIIADEEKLARAADQARKDAQAATEKAEQQVALARKTAQLVNQQLDEAAGKLAKFSNQTMDMPAGSISWVNQHSGTVWINLGRADSLQRQVTFSVYSADTTDLSKAAKKGSIEVTQIQGDHMAEARVVDDKISDPIQPGDKIFTPLWSPGEQTHFALAGIMNIDGDGRNALQTIRDLITMNGGVVDCELDGAKRTGEMTFKTNFLVVGDEPKQAELVQPFSRMIGDAERLHIRKMPLTELRQRMGYKKQTTLQQFGSAGAPGAGTSQTPGAAPKTSAAAGKAGGDAAGKRRRPPPAEPKEDAGN
ncbi:MAG: hypothetical protein ABSG68_12500 [Thermoguttaceae bacterium]|jgi:hypothetical protein